ARRVGHGQRGGHLAVEGQIDLVAIGQAASGLVITDDRESFGQVLDETAKRGELQLRAQVRDPARITQQGRTSTHYRVRDAARGRAAIPDPRTHPYRLTQPRSARYRELVRGRRLDDARR